MEIPALTVFRLEVNLTKNLPMGTLFVLFLAVTSISTSRAGPIVDTSGIAFSEDGHAAPYALFFDPASATDFAGICCDSSSAGQVLYTIEDSWVAEITSTKYALDFQVYNGTTFEDEVQAILTLGSEIGSGPYYNVTGITGYGDWGGSDSNPPYTPPYAYTIGGTDMPTTDPLDFENITSVATDIGGISGTHPIDNEFDPTGFGTVPEPSSVALCGAGLAGLALILLRKRKTALTDVRRVSFAGEAKGAR